MMRETSINQFSIMRILGCFSIVLLHSLFASKVYFALIMNASAVKFEIYAEHLLMWGVPIFLMITGALLLTPSREVTLKKLFSKYIKRVLIALIVFTFLFQILDYFMQGTMGGDGAVKFILAGGLGNLIFAKSWAHMWYLYMIIGLYLLMPMFKGFVQSVQGSEDHKLRYLIIVLLVFTSIMPSLNKLYTANGFGIPLETVYPLYLFLGYYLFNNRPSLKVGILMFTLCTVAIVLITPCQSSSNSMAPFFKTLTEYSSILVVGQTAGIFTIFNNMRIKSCSIVNIVDDCTFGIYLMHMIGIRFVMKWNGINPYEYGPWFFLVLGIILFAVFGALTYIVKSIPKVDFL